MLKSTTATGRSMDSSAQHHEAAARWLVRRDSGEWSDAEEAEFQQWLTASTGHRVAFIRLNTAWRETNRVQALGAGRGFNQDTPRVAEQPRRLWWWNALAASVLVAVAAVIWAALSQAPSYRTPVGGLASIPMSDGSKATLNTDSEIGVSVTEDERRIDLKKGEAFFEVSQDPSRPFVVRVGNRQITAVGTAFSVLRTGDEVRVVVTEGRVRVEESGFWKRSAPAELSAGQIARVGRDGVRVQKDALLSPDELLSWRTGFVVFRQTPLPAAAAELNRYNERTLVIGDEAVAAMHIGGTFRSTNVEAFVRLLEKGFPIRSEFRQGQVILYARHD